MVQYLGCTIHLFISRIMSRYLMNLALFVLALHTTFSLPGDPEIGYQGKERDALLALRDTLDNPFLKNNWNGLMCYMNNPPKWYGIQCTNGRVTGIVLEAMGLKGSIRPDAFVNLTQLYILSLKDNFISGPLMDFSSNPQLSFIDLSVNKFNGLMHQSMTTLPNLTSLQLNDNHINGHLPEVTQSTLKFFNVSYNDLTGPIPNTSVLQSFGFSSYLGNPKLCGPPTPTPCGSKFELPSTDAKGKHKGLNFTAIFIITGAALLLLVLLIVFFFCKRSKYQKSNTVSANQEITTDYIQTLDKTPEPQVNHKLAFISDENQFELSDLLKASAEELGSGNFGNTYKAALLHGGHSFVVKRMRNLKPMSVHEFERQVRFITNLQHPNLLPLVAFYSSTNEKLVIHKHIPGGNLLNRIQGKYNKAHKIPILISTIKIPTFPIL